MKRGLKVLGVFFFAIILIGVVFALEKESFRIEKYSNKLNLGESLNQIWSTSIDDDQLSNFLKDQTFAGQYDCTQKIYPIGNLELQNFSDHDYKDGEWTIGIKIPSHTFILNYSIEFIQEPTWEDLINHKIYFLGKYYSIIEVSEGDKAINFSDSGENLLELSSGLDLKYNGNSISDVEGHINSIGGKLNKITIQWKADDEMFVAGDSVATLPILEVLSFSMEGKGVIDSEEFWNITLDAFYEKENEPATCTDSDGGLDYYEDGDVNVKRGSSKVGFEDLCLKDLGELGEELYVELGIILESDKGNDDILLEGECNDISASDLKMNINKFPISKLVTKHECSNGCEDGKCIESSNNENEENSNEENNQQENNNQEQNQEQESSQNQEEEKFYIKNKVVSVEKNSEGKNVISVEGKSVETGLNIVTGSGKIYVVVSSGNKEIKISKDEAISLAEKISDVKEIIITQKNSEAVYMITGTKKARLFFIFPKLADVEQDINVENGEVIFTKRPWWSFLAWGV